MKNLFFLAPWERDKVHTWSGTTYSLYKALSKHFSLKDIDLSRSLFYFFLRILKKFGLLRNEMDISLWSGRLKVAPIVYGYCKKEDKNAIVFQFAEVLNDTPTVNTYIYQDLCVPFLYDMYRNDSYDYPFTGFQGFSERVLKNRAEKQLQYYASSSGVFTMGKWMRKYLVGECGIDPSNVFAVGGGINVDKELIGSNINKNGRRILFIGRDYKRKGLSELYEAFLKVKDMLPDAELYVAGPKKDPFPEAVNGYHYMGDCPRSKLSDLYNLCDVFAMPSHFEAYGLVFIEALSYGLPCLGRNAYEMPYFIEEGKTGYLIESYDPCHIAGRLIDLLQNEGIKREVASRKEWYLKEYSWDAVAERIERVILQKVAD